MLKLKELREKNEVELDKLLGELREEFRQLCFKSKHQQVKDTSRLHKIKLTIARILTLKKSQ